MKIVYTFNSATGEYAGESDAFVDPLTGDQLLPPNGTFTPPPPPKSGHVPVYRNGNWDYAEDHRGEWIIDLISKQFSAVSQLGPLPPGHVPVSADTALLSGDMGPVIPSSGLRYPIDQSDWELDATAGDYFTIISNQDLPFGGASDIILQCYDAGGHEVMLDTSIDRDGNVTIRSNHPAAMYVILLLASYIAHNGARYYFTAADWTLSLDPPDYYITIQHSDLPFEGSTDLIIQCYNNSGKLVYIDASVSAAGDVTIRSNNPFPGKLLLFKA